MKEQKLRLKASSTDEDGYTKEIDFGPVRSFEDGIFKAKAVENLAELFSQDHVMAWVENEEGQKAFTDGSGRLHELIRES